MYVILCSGVIVSGAFNFGAMYVVPKLKGRDIQPETQINRRCAGIEGAIYYVMIINCNTLCRAQEGGNSMVGIYKTYITKGYKRSDNISGT